MCLRVYVWRVVLFLYFVLPVGVIDALIINNNSITLIQDWRVTYIRSLIGLSATWYSEVLVYHWPMPPIRLSQSVWRQLERVESPSLLHASTTTVSDYYYKSLEWTAAVITWRTRQATPAINRAAPFHENLQSIHTCDCCIAVLRILHKQTCCSVQKWNLDATWRSVLWHLKSLLIACFRVKLCNTHATFCYCYSKPTRRFRDLMTDFKAVMLIRPLVSRPRPRPGLSKAKPRPSVCKSKTNHPQCSIAF